jgi:hypothetical protein
MPLKRLDCLSGERATVSRRHEFQSQVVWDLTASLCCTVPDVSEDHDASETSGLFVQRKSDCLQKTRVSESGCFGI